MKKIKCSLHVCTVKPHAKCSHQGLVTTTTGEPCAVAGYVSGMIPIMTCNLFTIGPACEYMLPVEFELPEHIYTNILDHRKGQ